MGFPERFINLILDCIRAPTVGILLDLGADADMIVGTSGNALCVAAEKGHVDVVRRLLRHGVDINLQATGYWKDTALTSTMNAVRRAEHAVFLLSFTKLRLGVEFLPFRLAALKLLLRFDLLRLGGFGGICIDRAVLCLRVHGGSRR